MNGETLQGRSALEYLAYERVWIELCVLRSPHEPSAVSPVGHRLHP